MLVLLVHSPETGVRASGRIALAWDEKHRFTPVVGARPLSHRWRCRVGAGRGARLDEPMKVKGPGRRFPLDFGGRIGRGGVAEGLRSLPVASVSAGRRSTGAIRPVFGRAGSAPTSVCVALVGLVGARLLSGASR